MLIATGLAPRRSVTAEIQLSSLKCLRSSLNACSRAAHIRIIRYRFDQHPDLTVNTSSSIFFSEITKTAYIGPSSVLPINLMVFSGAFNWPVWVAQDRDLFARNGLTVNVSETPGSVVQWTSLAEGRSDIAITLMDNVVAYREGQGEAPVTVPDAIAVMASDARLMPALMTQPDIKSYDDLRGQTL